MRLAVLVSCALMGCAPETLGHPHPDAGAPAIDAAVLDAAVSDAASIGVDAPTPDAWAAHDAGSPSGPAACSAGGQVASSSGAEAPFGTAVVAYCRMALGCSSSWTETAPPDSYRTHGTPNQKLLWRTWYYGWAQRNGTPAQIDDARALLRDFFDAQETAGHQTSGSANEILTTSHHQIWANGTTCARLLAVHYDDPVLLSATGAWWRHEVALYRLLGRGGSIDAPGSRFNAPGPSQLRDVIYAMIEGRPLSGAPARATGPWWDDYYNVAAWTLRELLRLGDDLGGAAGATASDLPLLHDPLDVYTRGDDFVFVFPRMRGALDPLFWVAHIGGTTSYAPTTTGTPVDNPNPPPALPGATLLTVPGAP